MRWARASGQKAGHEKIRICAGEAASRKASPALQKRKLEV
jgi:hypothetical protein